MEKSNITIPYGHHEITESDVEAVVQTLRSDFLTQGENVPLFEQSVARYCGVRYGVAVNSATSALHLSCLALGIVPGDIVWTSAISFVASANCARYCGASVDFVDIDPVTFNMNVEELTRKLEHAERLGQLPKIVIPVHMAGHSCNMSEIYKLSQKFGFKVIEDASHAIGGKYQGQPVGSCQYSDITVFSFHPVKIITTGEGGMAVTNSEELANKLYRLRSHGITRVTQEMSKKPDGPWYYEQVDLGFNYRLTDLQAALGLSQLSRLDGYVQRRQLIARKYNELLDSDDWVGAPVQTQGCLSSMHLYIVRINYERIQLRQNEAFKKIRSLGVQVNLHYIPIYRHPYYYNLGYNTQDFPEAELYYKEAMSLPIFPTLTDDQQMRVVDCIRTLVDGNL